MRPYHLKRIYQGLVLLSTAGCFFYLRASGESYQLAKPIAGLYAQIFAIVLVLLGLCSLYYGFRPGYKFHTGWRETVFLASLGLMVLLTFSKITGASFAGADLLSANTGYFYFGTSYITSDSSALLDYADTYKAKGMAIAKTDDQGFMLVDDTHFVNMVDDLYINLDDFIGQKVKIQGFAIRMQGFKTNQLVVSRLVMTCCAADASGVGLMAEGDDLTAFKDDDWLEVEGVIEAVDYDGDRIPLIKITQVKPIEAKENKFVYYN